MQENRRRSRQQPPFQLDDCCVFTENRYFDIDVIYAKSNPETILCRICITNRGPQAASLHLLPTLWFRNNWSWGYGIQRPQLIAGDQTEDVAWSIEGYCSGLGTYRLMGRKPAQLLFTENNSNFEKLWGQPNKSPFVKDAFHRTVIQGDQQTVNPAKQGSKSAAWHQLDIESGAEKIIELVFTNEQSVPTQAACEAIFKQRHQEADQFYQSLMPVRTSEEDQRIFRQALAGMIWNKQFYHFDVARWQDGDKIAPPKERIEIRNRHWRHLKAYDIIFMLKQDWGLALPIKPAGLR
jgi:hypothetical protein